LSFSGVGAVHPVSDPEMAADVLRQLLADESIAIILVDPLVARINSELIRQAMIEKVLPVILEIPSEEERKRDPLRDLIRYSVGVDLEM